ncbi:MAG: hypothetical protein HC933_04525 [Pleurocapsa sp. SU_196_0]|nr:hypothetical protein [Pleurocapsa sp. SU_196_0]
MTLLSKNPAERPGSAGAVIEALALALVEPGAASSSGDGQARADALLLAPLIGRDVELDALKPLIQEPTAIGGVYAVTGDVGRRQEPFNPRPVRRGTRSGQHALRGG